MHSLQEQMSYKYEAVKFIQLFFCLRWVPPWQNLQR